MNKNRASLLMALLLAVVIHANAQGWEDISQPIFEVASQLDTAQDVLNRGVGGILYRPEANELLAVTNGVNGLFSSKDQGNTWQKVADANLNGRHYGGFSFNYDYEHDRYIIFMITRADSLSATSLLSAGADQGFIHFQEPQHTKHDAWTWGMPAWSEDTIQIILGKEHHAWTKLWLSQDSGQNWKLLDFESRNPGVINDSVFVAGNDDGMYRTTDQGENWQKINIFVVTGKNPIKYHDHFYWTTAQGLISSTDQGKTWKMVGDPLADALYGPYFGKDQNHMMLVSKDGFFITKDSGKTWEKQLDYFNVPDSNRDGTYNVMHPTNSYGWDWKRNIIYVAGLGGRVYRYRLEK